MNRRPRLALGSRLFAVLLLALPVAAPACGGDAPSQSSEDVKETGSYRIDFAAFNERYPDVVKAEKTEDAWTALIKVGETTFPAPTHLFGDTVRVVPYSNSDEVEDAKGNVLARGDQEVARIYGPGDVGIAVKMHRPERRFLDLNEASASDMKEDFKLQDTHIEVVVGVDKAEHGKPGAITLNNPQNYEQGRFGDEKYSMIFLRPTYPEYARDRVGDYQDNVRLALMGFNAVTNFPGDYNGGDPLGARDPERLREYVDQMVKAIAGDEAAIAWFKSDDNLVYCAELAFISFSGGIIQPLTESVMSERVGAEVWEAFVAQVELHNEGVAEYAETGTISKPSRFVELNANKRVALVRLELPPEDLRPIAELAPNPDAAAAQLALSPMTMSDIVEQFMRTHLPREILGEKLAPVQAAVLQKMLPGLIEATGMDKLPESDPARAAVTALFGQIVEAVGKEYDDYAAFRAAIAPLLAQARQVTGPRGDTGVGLFVPPSLFHVAAQGKHHGLLGFTYEGHGLHVSILQPAPGKAPKPTPVDDIAEASSCQQACGGQAWGGCFCSAECVEKGDCCDDYAESCVDTDG